MFFPRESKMNISHPSNTSVLRISHESFTPSPFGEKVFLGRILSRIIVTAVATLTVVCINASEGHPWSSRSMGTQ